ncbi:MAG: hypothetical protein AAFW59_03980 [Pseudomonadota bacterium]
MTRRLWFLIGWVLYMGATLIKYPPWEHGWANPAIGVGYGLAVLLFSSSFLKLERRLGVGEARFDSETGKPLPPYEDGQ